jgi:hypothetical protein
MDHDDSARQAADKTHPIMVPVSQMPPMSPVQVQQSVVEKLILL